MKKTPFKLPPVRYAALAAAFVLCFTACPFHNEPVEGISINNLKEAEKKFAGYKGTRGGSPDSPLHTSVYFDLGDLSKADNDYIRLLKIIEKQKKYVWLNLYGKMGGGAVFTSYPFAEAVEGMDRVVRLRLPPDANSIMPDEKGRSPFFFYENLRVVYLEDIESIGDHSFADCSSLRRILYGYRGPPAIGEAAFLGSTPSKLTFIIPSGSGSLGIYLDWLHENVSKFNNYGLDIIFKDSEDGFPIYPLRTHLSIINIEEAEKILNDAFGGDYYYHPIYVEIYIDLGDLSQPGNNYLELLKVVDKVKKYVALELYGQMGGTTVFTGCPLTEAAPGMDMVTSLNLPPATKTIEADANGKSPFYFYKNLSSIDIKNVQAFGDNAFADCGSLLRIYFSGRGEEYPPMLGEGVFLGSTSGNLNLHVRKGKEQLFTEWLAENAAKFNNGGKDIVFSYW